MADRHVRTQPRTWVSLVWVNLDVKDFFPNVRHYIVYRMFRRELGFGRDVARLLTRLTTFRAGLPQGAPTSTAIANVLLALPVDGPISVEAERSSPLYTLCR